MGLFDSGGKGNSRANTSSSSSTTTNTQNNVDNRVTTSDFGAIETAGNIATEALDAGTQAVRAALDASGDNARDALSFGSDALNSTLAEQHATTNRAFDFGEGALSTVERLNANSIDLFGGLVGDVIDASKDYVRNTQDNTSQTLADALGGFKQLAIQNSETSDDKITKLAGYAFAAIAALIVLPALFKGGGKAVTI